MKTKIYAINLKYNSQMNRKIINLKVMSNSNNKKTIREKRKTDRDKLNRLF